MILGSIDFLDVGDMLQSIAIMGKCNLKALIVTVTANSPEIANEMVRRTLIKSTPAPRMMNECDSRCF